VYSFKILANRLAHKKVADDVTKTI